MVQERSGEPIFLEFGRSEALDAARMGFAGHEDSPLVALHASASDGRVEFVVMRLGPPPALEPVNATIYTTFARAADRAAELLKEFVHEAKAPFMAPRAFSDADRDVLMRVARILGTDTGQEGYADFRTLAPGAEACAVGVSVGATRIPLATFVATRDTTGARWSVRNFQNERIPGLPEYFASLAQAVDAHAG